MLYPLCFVIVPHTPCHVSNPVLQVGVILIALPVLVIYTSHRSKTKSKVAMSILFVSEKKMAQVYLTSVTHRSSLHEVTSQAPSVLV